MRISLHPEHLKRYEEIARLFLKYGHGDLVAASGLDQALAGEKTESAPAVALNAEDLATDLERMGPIFVKLGQVLSSRPDLLPPAYVKALSRLQDRVEPFPSAEVEEIVERELGVPISKAFATFDATPIAAASLSQVHRAALRDGRQVVVKVQRPGIRPQIAADLEVLTQIAGFFDHHTEIGKRFRFLEMLDEFRRDLERELDYRQEARNLAQIGENLKAFRWIVVPRPIEGHATERVLTMDYIEARKITELGPHAPRDMDLQRLAEELFRAYLQQILVDGFFHADPHPGNILVTDDGRLALLDLGMVGQLSPARREQLLRLMLAISKGQGEEAADLLIRIGETLDDFNEREFRRQTTELIARYQGASVAEIEIGKVMLELSQLSRESQIGMPAELSLLVKAMLNLDDIARTLDPQFDPNASIRRNANQIMEQWFRHNLSFGNLLGPALETRQFVEEMPGQVNRILDLLARNELTFHVDAIDEPALVEGLKEVAHLIASGLIFAALIVSAGMLMQVHTSFRLFGYPGFAMLCFLAAAGGGFGLLVRILLDHRSTRRKRL
jgi:ubiquinone biosynthesis protein